MLDVMMGNTFISVLHLFLLNILLYCGHAEDAVLTIEPNWSTLFSGESVTLTCDMRERRATDWHYTMLKDDHEYVPFNTGQHHTIRQLNKKHSGVYQCTGHYKSATHIMKESNKVTLTVSGEVKPDLAVSPSWLSPGASVTLNCSVTDPSAGWRFYWYKAVPKLSNNSYSYELLPGSSDGTEQDYFIIHGQTLTAGYVCRAGRGKPVFYTKYSAPKFVWSGDLNSAVSLTASLDTVQHFITKYVTVKCVGNSHKWRVSWFSTAGSLKDCSSFGLHPMNGSTCHLSRLRYNSGVYWCESEAGQFSNAVNITGHNREAMLVSPIHPVAEGASVTFGCRLQKETVLLSYVEFYKNGKLIQNDTRGELTIAAVSKSDEGFYHCKGQGWQNLTSPESWMSVRRPESSASPVRWIVGLVCGVLLSVLLLLFLYRYTKCKESTIFSPCSGPTRLQSTGQDSAADHMTHQDETQHIGYASLIRGDSSLYDTIAHPREAENGTNKEPEEGAIYANLVMKSAAGKLHH